MSRLTYEVTFKAVVTVDEEQDLSDHDPDQHEAVLEDAASIMARELICDPDFEPYAKPLLIEVDGEPVPPIPLVSDDL